MIIVCKKILAFGIIIFMFTFVACTGDLKTPDPISLPQIEGSGDATPTPEPSVSSTPKPTPTPNPDDVDNDEDGVTENEGDCDDTDSSIYLGAEEQCDGKDNDCDVTVDEGLTVLNVGEGQTYTKIQDAINAASNGNCVLVSKGVYAEDIDFKGKAITVQSVSGPEETIISGTGSYLNSTGAVNFKTNETNASVLDGFTISTSYNRESADERGVYILDSSPTIRNNIITKNVTTMVDGCAIYVEANAHDASPLIADNDISYNECQYSWAYGVVFIWAKNSSTSANISNNQIHDNVVGSNGYGGGISVNVMNGTGNVAIENNTIERNNKYGIQVDFQSNNLNTITIRNNTIQDNEYSGVSISYKSNVQNSNSIIENNRVLNNVEGGVYLVLYYDDSIIKGKIRNNILVDNGSGIGIVAYGANITIDPVEMTNNTITNSTYAGIYFSLSSSSTNASVNALINNNIFSSNGWAIDSNNSSVTSIIATYNDFYGNTNGCSDVSCTADNHNLFVDPLFEENYNSVTGEFDFHLQDGSECIDTGDDTGASYKDPDGSRNDMGAYGGPLADDWE